MPLQSIEPRRLYRKIADQLRMLIRDGEYGVGSRLPAERDLALQLGVSRPSVREALIALEVEGLVEVRPGSGVHVVARDTPASARRVGPGAFGLFRSSVHASWSKARSWRWSLVKRMPRCWVNWRRPWRRWNPNRQRR